MPGFDHDVHGGFKFPLTCAAGNTVFSHDHGLGIFMAAAEMDRDKQSTLQLIQFFIEERQVLADGFPVLGFPDALIKGRVITVTAGMIAAV